MARRADSIWRAVRRPRPTAFRPYSPKLTLVPRVASPLLRPFCSLRYFLLVGCSIIHSCFFLVRTSATCGTLGTRLVVGTFAATATTIFGFGFGCSGLFVASQRLTLVHPHLDADDTIGGVSFRNAVVDVGAQGVQGHTTFAVPFGTGNFSAIQTTRAHDLDALGTQTHGVLHRTLHGAAEHDPLDELLGDGVSDQLSIHFRLANFFDVHMHGHAHDALQISLQLFDVLALLADHNTRTGAENGDAGVLCRTLDDNTAHGGVCQLLLQMSTDLEVFVQHLGEVGASGKPAGAPVTSNRQTEAGRMDFLSHGISLLSDSHVNVAGRLADTVAAALCTSGEALQGHALFHVNGLHAQGVDIGTIVMLGIGNGRLDNLFDDLRALFGAEGQDVQRLLNRLSTDQVSDQTALLFR